MTPAEKYADHRPRHGQAVLHVDPDAKPPIDWLGLIVRVENDRAWVDYGKTNESGPVLERFTWCFPSGLNSLHDWATKAGRCGQCEAPAVTELDGDNLCQTHADAWCRGEGDAQQVQA